MLPLSGRDGSGSSWLVLPMWSKPQRATEGSSFAAFATHGNTSCDYKRTARYRVGRKGLGCGLGGVGKTVAAQKEKRKHIYIVNFYPNWRNHSFVTSINIKPNPINIRSCHSILFVYESGFKKVLNNFQPLLPASHKRKTVEYQYTFKG